MIDLDELERIERAATPGPWRHWEAVKWDDPSSCGYDSRESHRGPPYYCTGPRCDSSEQASTDASFIAAARNALPALIAELRAARRVVYAARSRHEEWTRETYVIIDEALRAYDDVTKEEP